MTIALRRPMLAPPMRLLAVGIALLLALMAMLAVAGVLSQPMPFLSTTARPENGITLFERAGDLWTVDTLDGEPRLLFGTTAVEEGPDWLPDGSRLSYLRGEGVARGLITTLPDGSDPRVLVEGLRDVSTYWWRPDSTGVLVLSASMDDPGTLRARLVAADGSGAEVLDLGGFVPDAVYWYPDSSAFLVRVMTPDGAELRRYDVGSRRLGDPILSSDPDGPLYATERGRSDLLQPVVNRDGSIFFNQGLTLDGPHELIFGGNPSRDFLADADGGNVRMVEFSPAADYEDGTWFSPDGTRLSLVSRTGRFHQLVVMDADGSEPIVATERLDDPAGGLTSIWLPDSSGVLIVRDEFDEVSRVDAKTGERTVLPWKTTAYPVTQPIWN